MLYREDFKFHDTGCSVSGLLVFGEPSPLMVEETLGSPAHRGGCTTAGTGADLETPALCESGLRSCILILQPS